MTVIALGKKALIACAVLYTLSLYSLLLVHFSQDNGAAVQKATIAMGLTLFVVWVLIGGMAQYLNRKKFIRYFSRHVSNRPILAFTGYATLFALLEEAIATMVTNLAPLYGVQIGEAYITASTNFLRVISLHSVIVFIPMFFTLGWLLKRYKISPFATFLLFGLVGAFAEITFAGPQALLNAPAWICIYGLMVYMPSHIFAELQTRKPFNLLLLPILVPIIAFSAIVTAWIPVVLDVPKIEF